MVTTITDLPNEVLQQILRNLAPSSLLQLQRVCCRFFKLADSSVWRYVWRSCYKYWDAGRHDRGVLGSLTPVDWRQTCLERLRLESKTTRRCRRCPCPAVCTRIAHEQVAVDTKMGDPDTIAKQCLVVYTASSPSRNGPSCKRQSICA